MGRVLEVTKDGRYDVPPFSKRTRVPHQFNPDTHTECAICGYPVQKRTARHYAVVVDGGAAWGDANSDANDPGYMGEWPVGKKCHKKYVSKAWARRHANVLGQRRRFRRARGRVA